jgi:hypothetical protein
VAANQRLQRTPSASPPSPLSRKPLGGPRPSRIEVGERESRCAAS